MCGLRHRRTNGKIAALTAIYNATGGDDWFDRTNWFSDEPVQFWSGISVNGEGHITELRLSGNKLSGQIPTELSPSHESQTPVPQRQSVHRNHTCGTWIVD